MERTHALNRRAVRSIFSLLLALLLLPAALSAPARASGEPVQGMEIRFLNVGELRGYAAIYLLATAGSRQVRDVEESRPLVSGMTAAEQEYWRVFGDYETPDGFTWLWRETVDLGETDVLRLDYQPQVFRLVLYDADSGAYRAFQPEHPYAFDAVYSVDVSAVMRAKDAEPSLRHAYRFGTAVLSFFLRVLLAVGLELVLALAFGYRTKKQLCFLLLVNAPAQLLMHAGLSVAGFLQGPLAYWLLLALLEFFLFFIKALLYLSNLDALGEKGRRGHPVAYAVTANAASMLTALLIAALLRYW